MLKIKETYIYVSRTKQVNELNKKMFNKKITPFTFQSHARKILDSDPGWKYGLKRKLYSCRQEHKFELITVQTGLIGIIGLLKRFIYRIFLQILCYKIDTTRLSPYDSLKSSGWYTVINNSISFLLSA